MRDDEFWRHGRHEPELPGWRQGDDEGRPRGEDEGRRPRGGGGRRGHVRGGFPGRVPGPPGLHDFGFGPGPAGLADRGCAGPGPGAVTSAPRRWRCWPSSR